VISNRKAVSSWVRQDTKRLRSGHVFSEGPVVYSYGYHFPMAAYHDIDGVRHVLVTTRGYSMSTSHHLGIVRGAIREARVLEVYDPTATRHIINIDDLAGRYRQAVQKFHRARTWKAHWVSVMVGAKRDLTEYCKLFRQERPTLLPTEARNRLVVELVAHRMVAA
jgi:hypothetical protein